MPGAAPTSRRPLLAALGALALAGVGLLAYRASQTPLGTIRACRSCQSQGQPLARGWVSVPAGDAWAVQLTSGAGAVLRGPARFEAAGGGRIAISSGTAFVASGGHGRVIALLPRDLQAGVEGASVGTAAPGTRLALTAGPTGNRVEVRAGAAVVSATTGEKKLSAQQEWKTGQSGPVPQPDAEEARWLESLTGP